MLCTPMVNVADVEASSRWYQHLLGLSSGHGGPDFEMLMSDGQLALMLHRDHSDHDHPGLAASKPYGSGVVFYFRVGDDFAAAVERVSTQGIEVVHGPSFNELAHQDKIWVRDPDGYTLALCGPASWA